MTKQLQDPLIRISSIKAVACGGNILVLAGNLKEKTGFWISE